MIGFNPDMSLYIAHFSYLYLKVLDGVVLNLIFLIYPLHDNTRMFCRVHYSPSSEQNSGENNFNAL